MLGIAEHLAKEQFAAVRINVICLMMKDPVVHFHVLPRFDREMELYGERWRDEDWPGPPVLRRVETSEDVLLKMVQHLRLAVGVKQ